MFPKKGRVSWRKLDGHEQDIHGLIHGLLKQCVRSKIPLCHNEHTRNESFEIGICDNK